MKDTRGESKEEIYKESSKMVKYCYLIGIYFTKAQKMCG